MDAEDKELILAHIINAKVQDRASQEVLTFVKINDQGDFLDEKRSYAELWTNGHKVAHHLLDEKMAQGDSFAIIMQNHPEFVDTMVGSSIIGTIFVPIDPRTKGKKLSFMLNHADCRGAVIGDYAMDNLNEIISECPRLEWLWIVGTDNESSLRKKNFSEILKSDCNEIDIRVSEPDLPMQMLYTSGTTGDPKAILSPYARFGFVAGLGEALGLTKDDRPYTGLSLTHANAQLITLGTTLAMGLNGVFSQKFTKSRLWDITRQYDCTMFNLLGGMTTAIYSEPERADDKNNPVRYVLSAGMPKNIWNSFRERFDCEIFEFYGAAEGGITLNPPGGPMGSIGKPPVSLVGKIVDENDDEVPPNSPGEIIFQNEDGSCPPVSYFKNPEASEKKTDGGWLRMGDVGYKDADGWYYFLYRKGGGIRKNGDFINPAFVEKELAENSQIDDVFVYGVTSANGVPGEKDVVAAVVPVSFDDFHPDEVFQSCRANLESNFVPTYLQLLEEIPKTASEKPQERFLLEDFEAKKGNIFIENQ
tara:strand:- start:3871 stop:5466 length:1596 start_codon:yes stop_codon:yes gene_type:complete